MADPAPLSFKTRGGGGARGVAYKDRARPPPCGINLKLKVAEIGPPHPLNSSYQYQEKIKEKIMNTGRCSKMTGKMLRNGALCLCVCVSVCV